MGLPFDEEDLRLRGEGDVLGTRQSGFPGFTLARMDVHVPLLTEARARAGSHLSQDARLAAGRGDAARLLLYLHGRDAAMRFLSAGEMKRIWRQTLFAAGCIFLVVGAIGMGGATMLPGTVFTHSGRLVLRSHVAAL